MQRALLTLVLSCGGFFATHSEVLGQSEITVGTPSGDGLPDGVIVGAGTQTTYVQPVHYQVFPVKVQARAAMARLHGSGAVSKRELPVSLLANLAMQRAADEPLGAGEILALAVGNDSQKSHRLIVFNRLTSARLAIVARALPEEITQDSQRRIGLVKFAFVAGGNETNAIRGGNFQLVSSVFASRKALSMVAGGNGFLDFTSKGVNRRAVLTSVSLQVTANPIGAYEE